MPHRTSRPPQTAEPFVTLSLPRAKVTDLKQDSAKKKSTVPDESHKTPRTPTKSNKKLSVKANSSKPFSQLENEVMSKDKPATPLGGLNGPLQPTTPATVPTSAPLKSRVLTLKYKTPSNSPSIANNSEPGPIKSVDRKSRLSTNTTPREKRNSIDSRSERRSSTASLTDTGTRSSGRARKLTSKAQALAGTNFLPSLQNTVDVGSTPDQDSDIEIQNDEQEANKGGESHTDMLEHRPIKGKADETPTVVAEVAEVITVDMSEKSTQQIPETSTNKTPEEIAVEAPVESVEPAIIRVSARERKPTSRAVELGSIRASRKRPSSPLSVESASKMSKQFPSKSNKPSKLRHSSVNTESASISEIVAQVAGSKEPSEVDEVAQMHQPNHNTADNLVEQDMVSTQDSNILPDQDLPKDAESKAETHGCNLECLSPSARLIAFAKLAADWSDSDGDDDDSDDDDDIDLEAATNPSGGSNTLLEKVRQLYCQCPTKPKSLGEMNGTSSQPIIVQDYTPTGPPYLVVNGDSTEQGVLPTTQKPTTQRPKSSFERRMQADYLDSSLKKKLKLNGPARTEHVNKPDADHSTSLLSTEPPSRSLRARHSESLLADGSRAESESVGYRSENLPANVGSSIGKLKLTTVAPRPDASIQLETAAPKSSITSMATKPVSTDKSVTKTSKVKMRGGGKSSSGGSVRLSLFDGSGKELGQNMKQFQPIVPPQAKSIKLRFTTGAK